MTLDTTPHSYATWYIKPLGDRWLHTEAVAAKVAAVAPLLGLREFEQNLAVGIAWLHDLGYAFPDVHPWHPLAGALYLRENWNASIAGYVAWHSTAEHEGPMLGYGAELMEFERPHNLIQTVVDWADMTTGPRGEAFTLQERLAEIGNRHGKDSTQYNGMVASFDRLNTGRKIIRRLVTA
ncbi:hypothetical protein [Leifsonia sp. Leaf264]|uniref:hypothetical protein n=1 Tax=Leifsonia sp. Leaf264 TaxID=1736314 RepID=UPI0006F4D9BE|nr:hypothetical protein [Leifsonia sp. Leaf264]KQO98774.1 hypothetical protein ASF30_11980 [Leifsonia sp. Leaf264]